MAQQLLALQNGTDWWPSAVQTYNQIYADRAVHIIQPSTTLEHFWINVITYLGEFHFLVIFYLTMNFCYAIGGFFFWLFDKFHLFQKYKIQPNVILPSHLILLPQVYPTSEDYKRCILNLVVNYITIIMPMLWIGYPVFCYLKFEAALPLPSMYESRDSSIYVIRWTFSWQFFFCMVMEDFTHYWLHRTLHIGVLYKNIHKIHHTYAAPFGLTGIMCNR
jgi:sterol desaturase/sphingolipid hydroxylase (fatty acid hydroxylase superfamily)